METPASLHVDRPAREPPSRLWLPAALAVAAVTLFLLLTPAGGLAKTKMVGYAICHQIPSHSFVIGGHQLPLCARCTGIFAGALVGFAGQIVVLRRRRTGVFPPAIILGLLVLFIAVMGIDGLNSYLTFFPGAPYLYEPANWLRLTTGALHGLAMSAIVFPVVGFTLWRHAEPRPAVGSIRDLAVLLCLITVFVILVLAGWSILLYPLALLSALGVLALLTGVNTVLVTMLAGKENTMDAWRDAAPALLVGLTLSFIEIGMIGALRYVVTGTLGPIPVPG